MARALRVLVLEQKPNAETNPLGFDHTVSSDDKVSDAAKWIRNVFVAAITSKTSLFCARVTVTWVGGGPLGGQRRVATGWPWTTCHQVGAYCFCWLLACATPPTAC